jgi:Zn-dependent M28 family amino/carboxypeptidase
MSLLKIAFGGHMAKKCLIPILLIAFTVLAQPTPANYFDGKSWWEHVKFLADDKLEGRDTGSEGLRTAEAYLVEQLKQSGVQPAGNDGSYYQRVKFVSRQLVESGSSATLIRDGKPQPLALGDDVIFNTRIELAPSVDAPLVFVGYGLSVPEKNYHDLASPDLRGKVAVILGGSPSEIPGPLASHYQTAAERWKAYRKAGIIGVIAIPNPASMDIPWSRIALNRNHPSMELADPVFNETKGAELSMIFNPAKADLLFAGTGHTFAELAALGKDRKPLPHFTLNASIQTKAKLDTQPIESANVIAKLPGSDPTLKNEYVVLSAHIDHIGIGEPINGDRIYNGAMDNASGSAALLDIAASLKKSSTPLQRSVLFVFVTGEEKGLLGSKYFAQYPTVDAKSIVADINIDMFLPIIPLKLLTVWGVDESTLGDLARQVADSYGVNVQADPEPQRNIFIRSDQYNFIRHGVPSLAMGVSPDPNSPEQKKVFKEWLTNRYHAPSDDTAQPVDLAAAGLYEDIVRAMLVSIANNPQRPSWKPDSFFRRYATGS